MTGHQLLIKMPALLCFMLLAIPLFPVVLDVLEEHTTLFASKVHALEPADYPEVYQHLRRSLQQDTADNSGSVIGTTITVDFYRTFEQINLLGFLIYRQYNFPKYRAYTMLYNAERWFNNRVKFAVGEIYDYENLDYPMANVGQDFYTCFQRARALSRKDPRFNRQHISIIVSQNLGPLLSCHGGIDSVLGREKAAIGVVGTNYQSFLGGSLSHALGHLLGLDHTTEDFSKGLRFYEQCGLSLQYPWFPIYNETDFIFGRATDVFVHNGVRYDANEWLARSNILARHKPQNIIVKGVSGELGVFVGPYAPIFEQIVQCWFDRKQDTSATANETTATNHTV